MDEEQTQARKKVNRKLKRQEAKVYSVRLITVLIVLLIIVTIIIFVVNVLVKVKGDSYPISEAEFVTYAKMYGQEELAFGNTRTMVLSTDELEEIKTIMKDPTDGYIEEIKDWELRLNENDICKITFGNAEMEEIFLISVAEEGIYLIKEMYEDGSPMFTDHDYDWLDEEQEIERNYKSKKTVLRYFEFKKSKKLEEKLKEIFYNHYIIPEEQL